MNRARPAFSTTSTQLRVDDISKATLHKEAPIVDSSVIVSDPKDVREKERLSELISIPVEVGFRSLITVFFFNY